MASASGGGSSDGTGEECEESEDPSPSELADVKVAFENLEPREPQDELAAFRQQWQQELKASPVQELGAVPATDTEQDQKQTQNDKDMKNEPQDELTVFRQKWQRELEAPSAQEEDTKTAATTEQEQAPQTDEDKAKYIFLRAVELERGGDLYEAIQLYKRAMQILPDIETRIYDSSERTDDVQEETEPEDKPIENQNQSDEDEEWIEGEELLARLQRIVNRKGVWCEPEVPTRETHISCLPCEVVLLVLRWVVSSDHDVRSLERAAATCRGLLVLARDRDLYRDLCLSTWGVESGIPRSLGFPSWRDMYISRPRLLLHGCYISKTTYLRQGENSFQDQFYRPLFLVHYYRYLRFFPDGTVLMWTTADEPAGCVSHLKTKQVKPSLGIMVGHCRLMGDKVAIVIKKSTAEKKQAPHAHARFRARRRDAPDAHDQLYHVELELRDHRHRRNFQLAWRGYSISSRRDQWTEFDITPSKFPPFSFSGVRSYMAEATAPL